MFYEYPKARYRNGVYMTVANKAEEDAMSAVGWTDWHTDRGLSAEVEPVPQSLPALPGEGPETPLTASVGVHSVIDQAAIAVAKRKPGRPPKAK